MREIIMVILALLLGLIVGMVFGVGVGYNTYEPAVVFKDKIIEVVFDPTEHYDECFNLVKESREFTKDLWEMDIN